MTLGMYRVYERNLSTAMTYEYYGLINKQDAVRTKENAEIIIRANESFPLEVDLVDIKALKQTAKIFLDELERDCPEYFV